MLIPFFTKNVSVFIYKKTLKADYILIIAVGIKNKAFRLFYFF